MSIQINRSGNKYEATYRKTGDDQIVWQSPEPLSRHDLITALRELGCHQTDIGDAFYEADPEWLLRP